MKGQRLHRRSFIAFLGSVPAAWPMAMRAQQAVIPSIGYLHAATPESAAANLPALRKGLSESGFIEGSNLAIEYRFAGNDYNRLEELAADLVRRRVAVIVALGGAVAARAAKAATGGIPIVFAIGDDPVATGLVTRLNRPGGNVTGVTFLSSELGPKRLGLLNQLVPGVGRYAVLVNPNSADAEALTAEARAAAAAIGKQVEFFAATSAAQIDAAFAELARKEVGALVISSNSFFAERRVQLATLAATHHLPTIYYDRRSAEVGGLMSYGANILEAVRQTGIYAGRILKGEKPADLPVMQAVKFEFVINMQTARALALIVPPALLAIADEVIE
jgi:putative ABC transport system substrate-binding protein